MADAAAEDVRTLARLYQLQNKMEAVGHAGAYDARLERVLAARAAVEQRLLKRLDLIDGFARVVNMIEIEVSASLTSTGCFQKTAEGRDMSCILLLHISLTEHVKIQPVFRPIYGFRVVVDLDSTSCRKQYEN